MKRGQPATAVRDRCACGWQPGSNLSGDCVACNEIISNMPGRDSGRKRRTSPAAINAEPLESSVGEAPQPAVEQCALSDRGAPQVADDDFETERSVLTSKAPRASNKQAEKDVQKKQADDNAARNGFVRAFVTENGQRQASLTHADWHQSFVPRDGHCLMHCFVEILQQRQPGHEIKFQSQMREAIAQYFEASENNLQILEFKETFGNFQCESIECMRTGRDNSGKCRHYGGIAECVAFSYRFGISLEIHAPESMYGVFKCNGGGATDHAPEALMMTFGWHGNQRRRGADHWQRMINIQSTISAQNSLVPNDNCVVSINGEQLYGKVHRSVQCSIPGGLSLVYCYALYTHYGQPLGHFSARHVQGAPVHSVSSSDDNADDIHVFRNDEDDANESQHDDASTFSSGNEAKERDDPADQDPGAASRGIHRAPGRKPTNADADTTIWCQDTLVCFLRTVVARNPFEKQTGKISDKWAEIAFDMSQATSQMGIHAVTARPDALRIKFARLKTQLKNFRQHGKSGRQSGIASVRERNKHMSELADVMDECLNLQKDVQEVKSAKKDSDEAAKKCNKKYLLLAYTHVTF